MAVIDVALNSGSEMVDISRLLLMPGSLLVRLLPAESGGSESAAVVEASIVGSGGPPLLICGVPNASPPFFPRLERR